MVKWLPGDRLDLLLYCHAYDKKKKKNKKQMYSRVKKFEPYLVVYLQGYKFLLGKKQTNKPGTNSDRMRGSRVII